MSSSSTVIAVLVGFLGTGGTTIAAFLKKAQKDAANIQALVVRYEAMANSVLKEITKLENQVTALTPKPAAQTSVADYVNKRSEAKKQMAKKQQAKKTEPKKKLR